MIRVAVIAPMLRWLGELGRDPAPFLDRADLAWVPSDDPLCPIPLRAGIRLLVEIARAEGPDVPHRVVDGRSGLEIGLIGAAAFSGATLIDGLQRAALAMPLHCTHEIFTVRQGVDAVHVRDGWAMDLGDAEAKHLVQQYVAALIDMVCQTIAAPRPCLARVAMVRHPEAGLDHLRSWLGERLSESSTGLLDIEVAGDVANIPIPAALREAAAQSGQQARPLREGPTLSDDVLTLVTAMLACTPPTLDRVADAAGLSARTLRRRLREEGQCFSGLVEQARARVALRRLREEPNLAMSTIAREIGYADQATLSRAVRRWIGRTPRDVRGTGMR